MTADSARRCPHCGRSVPEAAVKCAGCHSDLPTERGGPESAHPQLTGVAAAAADPGGRRRRPGGTAGLGALCAVLAAVLAVLLLLPRPGSGSEAGNGQVVSALARSGAMTAAAEHVEALLSYDHQTLAADLEEALSRIRGDFASAYADTISDTEAAVAAAELSQRTTVQAVSLVSLTSDRAEALVFAAIETSADGSVRRRVEQGRVLLSMVRHEGSWFVSDLKRF